MDFQTDTLHVAAQAESWHERAVEFGERAWRVKGKNTDVIYWDTGNGWSSIVTVIPHTGGDDQIMEFWQRLLDMSPDGELAEGDAE